MRDGRVALAAMVLASCSARADLEPVQSESARGDRVPAAALPADATAASHRPPRDAFPEFLTGDECLFCHRTTIGPEWPSNRHQRTVRQDGRDLLVGAGERTRVLRPAAAYGHADMRALDDPTAWDEHGFASRCAGCHASALEPTTGAFAALSIECFVCHGEVRHEHARDASAVMFSSTGVTGASAIVSACAQCHLRTGRSRSTGRPWPARFVAGDALLDDFEVDLSDDALARAHPIERHIAENLRDVELRGETALTCASCHRVHGASTARHRRLEPATICSTCHDDPRAPPRAFPPRPSLTCEFET